MTTTDLVIVAAALLLYALVSRRLSGTVLTSPMAFALLGIALGPRLLDLVDLPIESEELGVLAEATLALVLFTDASSIDSHRLRREDALPIRLLGLALPLSIVVGAGFAYLLFSELYLFEAVALAILLAPTDAALGQAVVADERIPSPVRQGLNVESGLNDGVCVPLLVSAVTFAELEEASWLDGQIIGDLVRELAIAVAIGAVVAAVVASLVKASIGRDWLDDRWGDLVPLLTAAVAYIATTEAGGSGFIGSFVAGLVYGRQLGSAAHQSTELTEDLGGLLSSVTFFLFGAVLVSSSIERLDVETAVYAVASLTVVRMAPVAIALVGSGAAWPTRWFAGWFGPRGLATIVFALTVIEGSGLDGTERIVDVATLTVMLSVLAHGATAAALSDRYVRWFDANRSSLPFESTEVHLGTHRRIPRPAWFSSSDRSGR